MFIETEDKGWINLSNVVRVKAVPMEKNKYVFFITEGGEDGFVEARFNGDIEKHLRRGEPFAAQVGYSRLDFWFHDGGCHYEEHPVIAWVQDEYGGLDPVSADAGAMIANHSHSRWAIKFPDGRVIDKYYEEIFPSIDKWVESLCGHLSVEISDAA